MEMEPAAADLSVVPMKALAAGRTLLELEAIIWSPVSAEYGYVQYTSTCRPSLFNW